MIQITKDLNSAIVFYGAFEAEETCIKKIEKSIKKINMLK